MANKKRGAKAPAPVQKSAKIGSPLVRKDNYITTKNNWQLSEDEYRDFRNLVKKVNRKRDRMIKELDNMPLFRGKKKLDEDRQQLRLMGEEDEIAIRKRSSSINQFKSRKQFNAYMKNLGRVMQTDYIAYRVKQYKKNYMQTLKNEFAGYPELVNGVIMKVQMMSLDTFKKFMSEDRLAQIKNIYGADRKIHTLIDLRDKLGLFIPDQYKDLDVFDMTEYF